MTDKRRKNVQWTVCGNDGRTSWDAAHGAILMDIRDELQELNRLLGCQNFIEVPHILREIRAAVKAKRKRTTTRKRRAA